MTSALPNLAPARINRGALGLLFYVRLGSLIEDTWGARAEIEKKANGALEKSKRQVESPLPRVSDPRAVSERYSHGIGFRSDSLFPPRHAAHNETREPRKIYILAAHRLPQDSLIAADPCALQMAAIQEQEFADSRSIRAIPSSLTWDRTFQLHPGVGL